VLLHYLVKRRNMKIAFSLQCCISAMPEFNHLFDFFNLFDSRLILTMLQYDSISHVINAFSPQGCWGHGSRERKSTALQLHAQCTSALSSGFPISQGNAEALERWGGKTRHRLMSYFLSSTSAKNYRNRIVNVETVASQRWDVFETRCTTPHCA